ncbi:hypothetical protein [Desulfatitalea tepidiphila]|uniref:hypothetical protein n=1 Tax=Desulfatitalea tepidiphila TaxID=1185843 RepID=UPI00128EEFD1|nr:hypothetical protein [Desulfatitalea tepidiphila]
MSTTLTPASHSDSTYLPYATIYSMHTDQKINVVYADKGYAGAPNRNFLSMNKIADGIMRKTISMLPLPKPKSPETNPSPKNDTLSNSTLAWPPCLMIAAGHVFPPLLRTASMPCSGSLPLTCAKGPGF